MSYGVIAFLVAIGAATWIYTKLMRYTGGNTKSAVIAAAVSGVLIFALVLIISGFLPD